MYRQQMEATRCTTVETTKRGGQKKKSSISMIASPPHKNLAQSRLKNFLKAAPTISKQHQLLFCGPSTAAAPPSPLSTRPTAAAANPPPQPQPPS
uniref:Uncharacterized protein n=1 Tax=Setaria italica TaxID=4555 RepID=K3Y0X8_SETIT